MTDVFAATTTDGTVTDPLASLVGEGKKFKDVAALAAGKVEADAHIARLTAEMAGLRAELNPQFDAEKSLAELRAEIAALKANPDQSRSRAETPPALTVEGITALVSETITRAERNRTSQQNIVLANDAVVAKFGTLEAAGNAVKAKAAELNMTVADLRAIAEKSPSAFQKIVLGDATGADETPLSPQSAHTQTPNTPNLGQAKPGTKEYFEDLRVKDRKRYWLPETQMALHKAVKEGTYVL